MDDTTQLLEVRGFNRPDKFLGRFPDREAATAHAISLGHGTCRVVHPSGTDIVAVDQDGKGMVARDVNTPEQIDYLSGELSRLTDCTSFPRGVLERMFHGCFKYEQHPRKGLELGFFSWDFAYPPGSYEGLEEDELLVLVMHHLRQLFASWVTLQCGHASTQDMRDYERHMEAVGRLRSALTVPRFDELLGGIVEEMEERALRMVDWVFEKEGLAVPLPLPDPDAGLLAVV